MMSSTKTRPTLGNLGNYQLLEEIASGSFGTVYRACHWESQEQVAIKVIARSIASNEKLLRRFVQECQMASKINHPNIVRVIEYCCSNDRPFLVMEYVDGISLGEKIEREGALGEEEALRILVQVCQGLEQIHNLGLLHRDIKPDNILLTSDGVVKITDLGLAKEVNAQLELTQTGTGLGTPNFIAPEQFRNAKNVDLRCDVYGLAATMYQTVTGVLPFAAAGPVDILMKKIKNSLMHPQKINKRLSSCMTEMILKAMSIEPNDRYSSCWTMVESLIDPKIGLGPEFERLTADQGIWYVKFVQPNGKLCRATGRTEAIHQAIKEDALGNLSAMGISQSIAGPFVSVFDCPEFSESLTEQDLETSGLHSVPIVAANGHAADQHGPAWQLALNPIKDTPTVAQTQQIGVPCLKALPPKSAETVKLSNNGTTRIKQPKLRTDNAAKLLHRKSEPALRLGSRERYTEEPTIPLWLSLSILVGTGLVAFLAGRYLLEIF